MVEAVSVRFVSLSVRVVGLGRGAEVLLSPLVILLHMCRVG
jgi:hypothetical protein